MDQQLKKNTVSLTLLQIGQYVVPLIILPYLTRVLGAEGFGQFGFAVAFTMYFVLVVEWGFNLSATRDVSVNRSDRTARSVIFWETLAARAGLTLVSMLAILLLVLLVPKLNGFSTLIWLGVMQVLAATLSTAFYYQGIEKMGVMALINLGIRLLSIPLMVVFVREPDQVGLAFAIQAACFLAASLVNLALLLRSGEIVWVCPRLVSSWKSWLSSTPLFLSYAGTSLYTNSNVIILGFVASEAAVGYFVAGFTLVKAVVGLSGPFAQAVFPRASLVLSQDPGGSAVFLKKMLRWQGLLGLGLSLGLLVFLPWGVTWFYGQAFEETVRVVAWLSALPLLVCVASVLGMQTLVPFGQGKWFSGVLLTCGVLNCVLLFGLGYLWGATGAAIAVLITECVIMIGMALGVKRFAPDIWREFTKLS